MSFWDVTNPKKPKGIKDPDATLSYPIDFSEWLSQEAATYTDHEVLVTGGLLEVSSSHSAGIINVVLSGGTAGRVATFTVRITALAAAGFTILDDRTFYLKIEER